MDCTSLYVVILQICICLMENKAESGVKLSTNLELRGRKGSVTVYKLKQA